MHRLQGIIADGASRGQAGMNNRGPAFQAMVMIMVKKVGHSNRSSGRAGFDGGERGMIVHDVVGKQRLIAATAAKVQSGRIVERARSSHRGKQQNILSIPEMMFDDRRFRLSGCLVSLIFCPVGRIL